MRGTKQSRVPVLDCFTLRVRNDGLISVVLARYEAIQGVPVLDCFPLRVRNDGLISVVLARYEATQCARSGLLHPPGSQ
ncbi:MAG: hypothetical protein LBS88_08495 [Tannerellaceae bacterium]|nr:hypothetical protein [Tannerellaceae bacterium]